jgi:hypothetical protein
VFGHRPHLQYVPHTQNINKIIKIIFFCSIVFSPLRPFGQLMMLSFRLLVIFKSFLIVQAARAFPERKKTNANIPLKNY